MRVTAVILALSGALLMAYGWWGVNTVAGRRRYDEMAGMIPFGPACSACCCWSPASSWR